MPPAKWRYKCIMISWHWFSASTGWFLESKTRFFVTSSSFLLDPAIGSGHLLLTLQYTTGAWSRGLAYFATSWLYFQSALLMLSDFFSSAVCIPYLQLGNLIPSLTGWDQFFSLIGFAGMHVLLWEACKVDRAQQSTQAPGSRGQ